MGEDVAGRPEALNVDLSTLNYSPASILSLIATAFALIATLLMAEESFALRAGRDPLANSVRAMVRRFPRVTYALAIVIGMFLGHELWP
ncbi:MAG TPA: hypothetical protein VFR33_14610 [Candidatus Dormibacteraeota bacterium]|nr:hypothetical protein [Candidatus Dormibacteraeota bacterium]